MLSQCAKDGGTTLIKKVCQNLHRSYDDLTNECMSNSATAGAKLIMMSMMIIVIMIMIIFIIMMMITIITMIMTVTITTTIMITKC